MVKEEIAKEVAEVAVTNEATVKAAEKAGEALIGIAAKTSKVEAFGGITLIALAGYGIGKGIEWCFGKLTGAAKARKEAKASCTVAENGAEIVTENTEE